jgi:hypothetical protein
MQYLKWHCPELRDKPMQSLSTNDLSELHTCSVLGY